MDDYFAEKKLEFTPSGTPDKPRTDAIRDKGGNINIGVEDHPHVSALKTSSSVTMPTFFARRIMLFFRELKRTSQR